MALSDMEVFNDFLYRSMTETIDQQVQLFNTASGGALVLESAGNVGDYSEKASFKLIPNLVRRRDSYGSGSLTTVDIEQLRNTSVKVGAGTPPIRWEPQQFSWIQRNQEEAGTVIGVQLAEAEIQDKVNVAIAALVAATGNNANVQHDAEDGTLELTDLVKGAALFGDRASDLTAWVAHSKTMHDIYGSNLTNGQELFQFGTVNISEDGFGRRFIVTDSPDLIETDGVTSGTDAYKTLGLTSGAALVENNGDFFSNIETANGNENIQRTFQAEWSYNIGLKGYSWDKTNGGASPTTAELATGSNWDKTATSNKDTAGVIISSR